METSNLEKNYFEEDKVPNSAKKILSMIGGKNTTVKIQGSPISEYEIRIESNVNSKLKVVKTTTSEYILGVENPISTTETAYNDDYFYNKLNGNLANIKRFFGSYPLKVVTSALNKALKEEYFSITGLLKDMGIAHPNNQEIEEANDIIEHYVNFNIKVGNKYELLLVRHGTTENGEIILGIGKPFRDDLTNRFFLARLKVAQTLNVRDYPKAISLYLEIMKQSQPDILTGKRDGYVDVRLDTLFLWRRCDWNDKINFSRKCKQTIRELNYLEEKNLIGKWSYRDFANDGSNIKNAKTNNPIIRIYLDIITIEQIKKKQRRTITKKIKPSKSNKL
jgi:hypothetical protein